MCKTRLGSVTRRISDLQSDDPQVREEAVAFLWNRYSSDLVGLAQRSLSNHIRRREDEDDLVQDVFADFCLRHQDKPFVLNDRDDLWKLLVTITLCKARNLANYHQAAKRDARRDQVLSPATVEPLERCFHLLNPHLQAGPSPEDVAVLHECFNRVIRSLKKEHQRIAVWKLEGYTNEEIADRLGCSTRSVKRKSAIIRDHFVKLVVLDDAADA